jgi:site-specific DNA-methyltransferase (adenine-specific)
MIDLTRNTVHLADNLRALREIPDGSVPLIYIDPPFNTGKTQSRTQIAVERDAEGDRTGFGGERYRTREVLSRAWEDEFDDYLGFLEPRLMEAHRVLAPDGSLYFHIDYREVHYVKVLLDAIFGRDSFINEIIWAYDYGGRSKSRWPAKHDNILFYAKDPDNYTFNREEVDRIPYMAPGLVSKEKRERGKFPTDTWWHTIVSPTGKEKTGYPTQKPVGILRRIVAASSSPGDLVLDFFAGSGTTGAAALALARKFCLVDENPEAFEVMRERFAGEQRRLGVEVEFVEW